MRISRTHTDDIALLRLDDGKVNAFDLGFFDELETALDDSGDAAAVVLEGREGFFSAGLDTKVLRTIDDDGLTELLVRFGRAMLRLWLEPLPVVAAATGHAIAGGTILAMTCDHAVAAEGEFKWGLSETQIGFPMPGFVLAIARHTVRADRLDDLVLPGALVPPQQAVEAGFADVAVPLEKVHDAALARAGELAALPRAAYAATKRRLRHAAADAALRQLEADVHALVRERASGATVSQGGRS